MHRVHLQRGQGSPSGFLGCGAQGVVPGETRVTCTACAGTLLLEFGLLSRLTGNPLYEGKARHAALQVYGGLPCLLRSTPVVRPSSSTGTSAAPAPLYGPGKQPVVLRRAPVCIAASRVSLSAAPVPPTSQHSHLCGHVHACLQCCACFRWLCEVLLAPWQRVGTPGFHKALAHLLRRQPAPLLPLRSRGT